MKDGDDGDDDDDDDADGDNNDDANDHDDDGADARESTFPITNKQGTAIQVTRQTPTRPVSSTRPPANKQQNTMVPQGLG